MQDVSNIVSASRDFMFSTNDNVNVGTYIEFPDATEFLMVFRYKETAVSCSCYVFFVKENPVLSSPMRISYSCSICMFDNFKLLFVMLVLIDA